MDEMSLADLDLDFGGLTIGSARGGRRGKSPLQVNLVRELNRADLEVVAEGADIGAVTPSLVRLRHSHHLIAKMLSDGHKNVEVCAATGYSQSRISILQRDPAFKELVEYYRSQKGEIYKDMHQRMASLGQDAVEELQARLDENSEDFSIPQLMSLMESTMDRTVAPKKNTAAAPPSAPVLPTINISFERSPNAGAPIPPPPKFIDLDSEEG